jgi:uncharacterized protein YndB with AHSA1/START domain
MEKQQFNTVINASKENVWEALWDKENYKKWTSAFAEGSTAETNNWEKGSKVLFTDGKGCGMVAIIADNRPNEFMSFKHIGEVKDGVEDTESEKVKTWAGAHENYTLKDENGKTNLVVEMDINEEWKDYFVNTWPKALEKVKALAEGSSNV